jgi:phosphoesterase RecJ-like protein
VAGRLAQLPSRPPVVVIDHHLLTEGESAGEHWLLDAKASSTGELVWRVLGELGWTPPPAGLTALLLALASDTAFFSQANATPETLLAAADLVTAGGSLEEVNRRLRQGQPLRRLKLMGLALETLRIHFDGAMATMLVTPAMLKTTGAVMADTEDFVELGRSLAGVSLSALIKDAGRGPDTIRVSLRSQGRVDAQGRARLFGGGGHRQASAYTEPTAADAAEARANLLSRAEQFL